MNIRKKILLTNYYEEIAEDDLTQIQQIQTVSQEEKGALELLLKLGYVKKYSDIVHRAYFGYHIFPHTPDIPPSGENRFTDQQPRPAQRSGSSV